MVPAVKRLLATAAGLRPWPRSRRRPRPRAERAPASERANGGLAHLRILRVDQRAHSRGGIAARLGESPNQRAAHVGVLFDAEGGIDLRKRRTVFDLAQRPRRAESNVVIGLLEQMRQAGDRTTIGVSDLTDCPRRCTTHFHTPVGLGGTCKGVSGGCVAELAERPRGGFAYPVI